MSPKTSQSFLRLSNLRSILSTATNGGDVVRWEEGGGDIVFLLESVGKSLKQLATHPISATSHYRSGRRRFGVFFGICSLGPKCLLGVWMSKVRSFYKKPLHRG